MELKIGESVDISPEEERITHRPPSLDQIVKIHGVPPASRQVHIFVSQQALTQVETHGQTDIGCELGGLLLGKAYNQKDGKGEKIYVEVKAAIPALSDKKGPVHFTFTADAWANAHLLRETHYPDLKIIGWFHTHPNLGVFYSSDDMVVHSTAFSLPWHVGLVVDPVRDEAAFFGWEKDDVTQVVDIMPVSGFYELADVDNDGPIGPSVTWEYVSGLSLNGMRRGAMRNAMLAPLESGASSNLSLSFNDLLFAGVTATLILLLFFAQINRQNVNRLTAMEAVNFQLMRAEQAELAVNKREVSCLVDAAFIASPAPDHNILLGETVDIYGYANQLYHPRFGLQVRPVFLSGQSDYGYWVPPEWETIARFAPDAGITRIGRWRTLGERPGLYELRIVPLTSSPVTGEEIPLDNFACQIPISLSQ